MSSPLDPKPRKRNPRACEVCEQEPCNCKKGGGGGGGADDEQLKKENEEKLKAAAEANKERTTSMGNSSPNKTNAEISFLGTNNLFNASVVAKVQPAVSEDVQEKSQSQICISPMPTQPGPK